MDQVQKVDPTAMADFVQATRVALEYIREKIAELGAKGTSEERRMMTELEKAHEQAEKIHLATFHEVTPRNRVNAITRALLLAKAEAYEGCTSVADARYAWLTTAKAAALRKAAEECE